MSSKAAVAAAEDQYVSHSQDHDLEAAQTRIPNTLAAGIRDPLCRLATNKDNAGVQGRWRLIAAIVLCTLFMVSPFVQLYAGLDVVPAYIPLLRLNCIIGMTLMQSLRRDLLSFSSLH